MFNVMRPKKAPNSLLDKKSCSDDDVLEQLKKIFHDKCYICEWKNPIGLNVEHFIPHRGDDNLKYDWKNLYYSCSRCNGIKHVKYHDFLDCCDVNTDVVRAIKLLPPHSPGAKSVRIECVENNSQVSMTYELLNKIYNSDNTLNQKVTSASLRKLIYESFNLLHEHIINYYKPDALDNEKSYAIEKIKKLAHPSASFSAFMSWCILEDEELGPLLEDFIGLRV